MCRISGLAERLCFFLTAMQKITALEPQQRNPQRVNLYLDGEFACGLSRIVAAWLSLGQEISADKLASLRAQDDAEVVYQKALHFLSFRPRSCAEVRTNLLRRGVQAELAEEVLERLTQSGLLNDQAFAQAWVENRTTFRPRSRTALRAELRRKGVSEELIQTTLDGQVEEEALALEAARRQARRYAGLDRPDFRKKLGDYLARRGFSYTILAPVVSQVWEESQTADARGKPEQEE